MAEEVQVAGVELQESFKRVLALINFNKIMHPLLQEFEDGTANSIYGVRELRSSLPFLIYFHDESFDFSSIPPKLLRDCFQKAYPSATPWLTPSLVGELKNKYNETEVLELLHFVASHEHPTGYRSYEILAEEVFLYLLELKDELPDAPSDWLELVALGHFNLLKDPVEVQ